MKGLNYKISVIIFLAIAAQVFVGCSESDDNTPNNTTQVEASFAINDSDNLLVGQVITFTNTSTFEGSNINYTWSFGDESQTSSQENPTHIYEELGDYVVTLTASVDSMEDVFSEELILSLTSDIAGRNTLTEELAQLDDKIMICAHRGQHENAPENSLLSITNAINQGVRMVELDVRQTKDGELVLMHDATIDRTSNGSGEIDEMTLQELQQFNLFKDDGTITSEIIPSLREVLTLARGEIYIDIDIDNNKAPYTKVYQLVKQYGMLNQVMFYSSEFADINGLLQLDSNVYAMPIIRNDNDFNSYDNSSLSINIMHYNNTTFISELVSAGKQNGWYIFKNAYVNSDDSPTTDANGQINIVIDLEGDIIQTDYPTQVKNFLMNQNLN